MTAIAQPEAWTWLARVRRPQGRKGEVYTEILTDFPDKFSERHNLWLLCDELKSKAATSPRAVKLLNHWPHKGGMILHFEGINSITEAEELAGMIVAIPQSERATLGEDEAYIDDLVGCTVFDCTPAEPVAIGTIADVDRSAGPVALLVVNSPGGEVLIPFAKFFLRRMDLAAKRLEMALPEGLIELNSSSKS